MMNFIALSLLFTSLTFAGILSPPPPPPKSDPPPSHFDEQVIVKGGHRAVLVEYADSSGEGNTRISISPPSSSPTTAGNSHDMLSAATEAVAGTADNNVKEKKLKDAVGTTLRPNDDDGHRRGPRELVCDAYGKCKHKIAVAMSRAKEKVAETVHEFEEEAKEVVGSSSAAESVVEKTKKAGQDVAAKAGEKVTEKAKEAGEVAEGFAEKVKEKAKGAENVFVENPKRKGEEILDEVVGKAREAEEKAGAAAEMTREKLRKGRKEASDIARRANEVFCDAILYILSDSAVDLVMQFVHLLGFATAYGTSVWVTFVMSHVLALMLPRQQFGIVQSKIYPVYFKAMGICVGVTLLGHLMVQRKRAFSHRPEMLQVYGLSGSLLSVLINYLFLEPRATKVMFDRMKVEKEEGRGRDSTTHIIRATPESQSMSDGAAALRATEAHVASPGKTREQEEAGAKLVELNDRLKKLNMHSSLLNLATLMGLSWHLVYLSQRLQMDDQ